MAELKNPYDTFNMNIRNKLFGSIVIILFFIVLSFVLYFVMTQPINKMREEEKSFTSLKIALISELRVLGHLVPGTINKVYIKFKEQQSVTDDGFAQIHNLKTLPTINQRIKDAIEVITNMEVIIKKHRVALDSAYNIFIKNSQDVYQLKTDVKVLSYAMSDQLINHEKLDEYSDNLDNLVSRIVYLYKGIEVNIDVIDTQYEIINQEISKIKAKSQITSIILGIIMSGIGVILSFLISSRISKSLKHIDDNIHHLNQMILTKRFDIKSSDELGRLSTTLNEFLDTLNSSINKTKVNSSENIETRNLMISSLEDSSNSITGIDLNIADIENLSSNLGLSVAESEDAIGSIVKLIENQNLMIESEGNMIEDSTSSVNQIIASVNSIGSIVKNNQRSSEELIGIAKVGQEKLSKTTSIINDISSSATEIKDITKIIEDIASRTNLLAMNAAIEAANAGEAGRGFSVVANEIRKLSEASSKNSKEISYNLNRILGNIEEAGVSVADTTNTFKLTGLEINKISERISDIMISLDELGSGGSLIQDSMTVLHDLSMKIRSESDNMTLSTVTVKNSIEKVTNISTELQRGTHEITSGIKVIKTSISDVSSLGDQMMTKSEQLNNEVLKFETSI
ncbi:MAG: methyl-accepting chemotaxis protein [Spirochaetaceae bacterium]